MTVPFTKLIASFREQGREALVISEDWMQGRTTYGGLSAALCLEAAQGAIADPPPLRSAQISFIGPAGGRTSVRTELLRAGKSMSFIGADLSSESGLATRAVFAFGGARASIFDASFIGDPPLPAPEDCEVYLPDELGPAFIRHFDTRLVRGARPAAGSSEHELWLWVRHRDEAARSLSALVALADMPPPAVMPMFPEFARISSVTWGINLLTDDYVSSSGWYLLQTRAESARAGYSSQDMLVWDRDGRPVLAGRQSVAIFI